MALAITVLIFLPLVDFHRAGSTPAPGTTSRLECARSDNADREAYRDFPVLHR